MLKPNQSSHWYTDSGNPAYDADLRKARKEKLAPSVTSVIGILEKPAITIWKVNTMLECAYTLPLSCQTKEEWVGQVEKEWEEKTSKAAEVGSKIHDFCESFINGTGAYVKGYVKQCELIADWIMENIESAFCEVPFCNFHYDKKYGGRIDCYGWLKDGSPFVLDFKTQDMKGKNKPTYYPEFQWQLSAYKNYLEKELKKPMRVFSVLIDTSDIQQIHVKEYTQEDMGKAFIKFGSLLNAFYAIKELEF